MAPSPRQRFAQLAALPDEAIDLAEAALLIAAEAYPGLDVAAYIGQLDDLAHAARPQLEAAASEHERVPHLNRFLFVEKRFAGNQKTYYDPRNSFLNEVLDRRKGIPITLAVVYMEVARRVGLPVHGVAFPGHFLVKYAGEPEIIIDAFFGQMLTEEQCRQRLRAVLGPNAAFDRRYLSPATTKEILVRMLGNLKQIYLKAGDDAAALSCVDRMLLVVPDSTRELRDRGMIYRRLECYRAAAADLERFLTLAPDDESAEVVRNTLVAIQRRAARLH